MVFNSHQFLLFFPVVVLIYYLVPIKVKNIWLLISSYYFYICWDFKYAFLIIAITLITYLCAIGIEKIRAKFTEEKMKQWCSKWLVVGCCIFVLGILLFFKYFVWLLENVSAIFNLSIALPFNIILPIGVSFYTFQSLGYVIDVYREQEKAEKNLIKYALFVSFFPTLLSGPIERAKNLLSQLDCHKKFDYNNVKSGLLLMLWGFFEKIVIADKAAIIVDSVYNNYAEHEGAVIAVATMFFAIQIYCDFGGYSHIAIGAARVLNIDLMNNFRQPYFALNIKDFWARWHISLSSWFRDYIYIPLGGNRCSKLRKNCNLLITFLVSGLWHGASWHYVVWGALHGGYQIVSVRTSGIRRKLITLLKIQTDCFSYRLFRRIITFSMVSFIWLFFRANTMNDAIGMCKKIFFRLNPSILLGDIMFEMGLNQVQIGYLMVGIILLLVVDCLHEKNISIGCFLSKQNFLFRWGVYYLGVLWVIVSVIQTFGQSAGTFIYFQF